jgi:UDP-glucose 4-epimerase
MNKRKIFITGGCGFIGANLVKYLLDRGGYGITVYDNLSAGSQQNLERAISDSQKKGMVSFIRGDILDKAKINRAVRGNDSIIHLAAHTRVVESLKKPQENFRINAIGTFNILEAARSNRIKKIIFASSNAVLGEQTPPLNEKMIPKPISPYGAAKLYGEALCLTYYHSFGLKTVSLRFANSYGPYSEHKTSVVARFIKRAKAEKSLEIYGNGNQTRDFIHAHDVCQAIYSSLNNSSSNSNIWGEVFQVGTGIETPIINLAKLVNNLVNAENKIKFTSAIKGEIKSNYSEINKAKKLLKFCPTINLEQGIKDLINRSGALDI